ncbi:MAG: GMP synthase [Gaiellaceae bacterium]|nr:MAG: GMP synthase [Gaiellaceae bacterium]
MRVLSITHGPSVPGGVFEHVVEEAGHELDRWSVPDGDEPRPASAYDAVMVFGGSMHPDQDDEFHWLGHEEGFLRDALTTGVPVLGVCLGSQMVARAAGAWVAPAREPEVGWLEVELTPEGRADPVLGVLPERTRAFQWHSYTFGIPEGGVELARSSVCSQAFRVGRARGIQFHAEVTLEMVRAWIEEEPHELEDPAGFLAESEQRIASWNAQGRALAAAFLADAARAS